MKWISIKGYTIDYEGNRVEIGEGGANVERLVSSLNWYIENCDRVEILVSTENEDI